MSIQSKVWRAWRYVRWGFMGKPCHCGGDIYGHRPKKEAWCVFNT